MPAAGCCLVSFLHLSVLAALPRYLLMLSGRCCLLRAHAWQSGHPAVKLRLFEAFWNSDSGLIGEEGASGWSGWMTGGAAPAAPVGPEPPSPSPGQMLRSEGLMIRETAHDYVLSS